MAKRIRGMARSQPQPLTVCSQTPPSTSSHSTCHRRHHRLLPLTGAPSSCLLFILATIVSSSSAADGSPLATEDSPLSFLTPSFHPEDPNITPNGSSHLLNNSVTRLIRRVQQQDKDRPKLSDKYEEGEDGRWRRADSYSLYGSTYCPRCSPTPHPIVGDIVTNSSEPIVGSSPHPDLLDALPNGWRPVPNKRTFGQITLILTLSLVLAFVICTLMIVCVLWRRKRRRRRKDQDLEMTTMARHDETPEKQARIKQKFWARATARWKANAHARQRKRRRLCAGAKSPNGSSASLQHSPSPSTSHLPHTRSPPTHSDIADLPPTVRPEDETDRNSATIPVPPSSPPPADASTSPPAYNDSRNLPGSGSGKGHDPTIFYRSSHNHSGGSLPHGGEPDMLNEELPYLTSAHIAIDDKQALARMAELASAPQAVFEDGQPEPRAPIWQDENLQDFGESSSRSLPSSPQFPEAPPFPSPPPRLDPVSSLEHGDLFPDEADYLADGMSAPPFDAQWTAPVDLAPSAPALDDMLEGLSAHGHEYEHVAEP